ncbi:MAG: RDD family protein [Ktedonobacteraceae bacterium]|nr:RDD family protein [Ktedonobacteraceae bacterium]
MQNTPASSSINSTPMQDPHSKVLVRRFFALLIDSIVIAALIWLATRAFGMVQPITPTPFSHSTAISGSLIDAGGTFYDVDDLMGHSTSWVVKLPVLWAAALVFLYFVLQEAFFGATLGKAIMGLRVIYHSADDTYKNLTPIGAIIRNLIRFLDALPSNYFVGWIVAIISPRRQRLGDLAAHTLVVSCESAPYLVRSRKQILRGFVVIAALLLAFIIACQSFMYFGRPPLMIQNDAITDNLFYNKHVIRYTLGEKTWGRDNQGQQSITYSINFVSVDLSNTQHKRLQSCQGSVTLAWHWSDLGWTRDSTDYSCNDL